MSPSAMRAIQEKALDLFDERGFAAVTIEEIAAATDVSPSTVYRYFGTKEGLIVSDDFEALSKEALADILDLHDPLGSVHQIVADNELPASGKAGDGRSGQTPWRRERPPLRPVLEVVRPGQPRRGVHECLADLLSIEHS